MPLISRNSTFNAIADEVVNLRLPDLQDSIEKGEILVDNIDVRCAEGKSRLLFWLATLYANVW